MRFKPLSVVTSVFTYLTILVGGFTRGIGAGLGCGEDWPLCKGQVFPTWSNELMVIEWMHRYVALIAGILIFATVVQAWRSQRDDRRILFAATLAAILLPVQAMLGAITVWEELAPYWSAAHMGTASALFGAVVATTIFAYVGPGGPRSAREGAPTTAGSLTEGSPGKASIRDYASMTKPRIVGLLVAMGVAGIAIAPGSLSLSEAVWTLLGGAMGAGAGGIVNQVLERDLDARMTRTNDRAPAAGRVDPASALTFAGVLAATSFTMLAFMVNVLAAVLTMLAVLFYVFVYTLWLKPSTPQGVVIGGAAGAAPALVGFAAVTGEIGLPAILLGVLVFLWTPPHFWALAIRCKEEYASVGLPMMPVVRGVDATKRRMVLYTIATVLVAAAFYPLGYLGSVYLVVSSVLGLGFLAATLATVADSTRRRARGMFLGSIAYLFLVFASMVVDRVVVA